MRDSGTSSPSSVRTNTSLDRRGGTRTRNFNHSGQLEKFVTLGNCNAPVHQLTKYRNSTFLTRTGIGQFSVSVIACLQQLYFRSVYYSFRGWSFSTREEKCLN